VESTLAFSYITNMNIGGCGYKTWLYHLSLRPSACKPLWYFSRKVNGAQGCNKYTNCTIPYQTVPRLTKSYLTD